MELTISDNFGLNDQEASGIFCLNDVLAFLKGPLETARDLNCRIPEISQLPGFHRFSLGFTAQELKDSAENGPIVVFNMTDIRSDAIIISPSIIESLQLGEETWSQARRWLQEKLTSWNTPVEYGRQNKRYLQFLKWVWSACVRPVISRLEGNSSSGLFRIWWIGVGIANSLPFHAAGDYGSEAGPHEHTSSHVISSYTPTIKALRFARERDARNAKSDDIQQKLLIVTMPNTPDAEDLPGTKEEALAVKLAMKKTCAVTSLLYPTAAEVLNALGAYDMVHFGCHGISNREDPSRGCLVFQKGVKESSQFQQDRLEVRQINAIDLRRARIAFLSACSTAENKGDIMTDEVIHLVSSFQVAGFAHVIGSMWSTKDEISIHVAKGFYEQLALESNESVAKALHVSLENARMRWPKQPLCWAQYVHYGA